MMQRAAIREEIGPGGATARRTLPDYLPKIWGWILLATDALAVLASCYVAGLPEVVAPAACAIVCASMALCHVYRISYAVTPRDEVYHALSACALAAVPLWALLHFIAGLPTAQLIAVIVLLATVTSAFHAAFHVVRANSKDSPLATSEFVSPQAQWRLARPLSRASKRVFDVCLALAGLAVASPVMLAAAVSIAIESGLPVFFSQERLGRGGSRFTMFKFRTMRADSGAQWARPGDSRITRVGVVLRRTSIDELPQLFNILRGEMSLVGPRPEMAEFARTFRRRIPHYDDRTIVQPGLTGWAQVLCKRNLDPDDMPGVVPYDLFYVEHESLVLDVIIVAKTAAEFLFHRAV